MPLVVIWVYAHQEHSQMKIEWPAMAHGVHKKPKDDMTHP
jgi:hypothetical protein